MLTKLCDIFRQDEENSAHASVILLDEPMLQALLSAYSLMEPPEIRIRAGSEAYRLLDKELPGNGEPPQCGLARAWDLLWASTIVDWRELQRRAGIDTTDRTRALFKRLIAARLVYPDGTISETAKDILTARTIREIERMSGRPQRGGEE